MPPCPSISWCQGRSSCWQSSAACDGSQRRPDTWQGAAGARSHSLGWGQEGAGREERASGEGARGHQRHTTFFKMFRRSVLAWGSVEDKKITGPQKFKMAANQRFTVRGAF